MFNASELEGEVDHSFFDSDSDDGRVDGRIKKEDLKAEKQSSKAHKQLPEKHIKDEGIDLSPRTEWTQRRFKQAENNKKTRASDVLSVSCNSDKAISSNSDSEDDTNLSSTSPPRSLNLDHTKVVKGSNVEQQESVSSSGLSNRHRVEGSYQERDESTFSLESQLEHKLVLHCPGGRNGKRFLFTNSEVLCMEQKCQQYRREETRLSAAARSREAIRKKIFVAKNVARIHTSHSALNRQREQQRIERENLAFLKRLESVKSTPGLRRSEQLADYHRLTCYPGVQMNPRYRSNVIREGCSRRTSSVLSGPRLVSSRSTFANIYRNTWSKKTVPRIRPAWC